MKIVLGWLFFMMLTSCERGGTPVLNESKDTNSKPEFSLSTSFENNFLENSDLPSMIELVTSIYGLKDNSLEKLDELYLDGTGNHGYSYYRFGKNEHSYLVVGVYSTGNQNTGFYNQLAISVEIVEGEDNKVYKWNKSEKRYQRQVIRSRGSP